jgi:putative ABC transport system permease protein
MFAYYCGLALRSLRRNGVLTALMITAIGVGIGASMTTLTVFRAMDGDPIPRKSTQLFAPQIDNWGPKKPNRQSSDHLADQLSYTDAVGLLDANAAPRQAASYTTGLALIPANPQLQPFQVRVRATTADFFPMFEVPFEYGSAWSRTDDTSRAATVVISRALNDKVFGGGNSVGSTLNLDNRAYRVAGVIDHWQPLPKFYDLVGGSKYDKSEDLFMPFRTASAAQLEIQGNVSCKEIPENSGWSGIVASECVWTQFWVELPTAADQARYRAFLDNYAAAQQRSGRFHWPPHTQLRNVKQWLVYEQAVSSEVRILVLVSFSFLVVCLLNAMGLLLAKIMGRAGEIGVRRALGATRRAIYAQCLIEAGVVGLAGGLLGLLLTLLGLAGLRLLLSEEIAGLTRMNAADVGIALVLAVGATLVAGLYPTWRAAQVQPAWQLKAS